MSLHGFASDGVYHADIVTNIAGALLPHRFTLTHYAFGLGHNQFERFAFCGTFPKVSLAGR